MGRSSTRGKTKAKAQAGGGAAAAQAGGAAKAQAGITGGGTAQPKALFGTNGPGTYVILYLVLAALAIVFIVTGSRTAAGFINLGATGLEYVTAKVVSLDNSELAPSEAGGTRLYGAQQVELELLEGSFAGRTVSTTNYLLSDYYVFPAVGETVIASVENRGDGDPYCLLINHHRVPAIVFIVVLFAALHILTCGVKGIHALAGLTFTMITIIYFTIPLIYYGYSPVLFAIITSAICSTASLLLLNGLQQKTLVAALASYVGFCFAGLVFSLFSLIGNVTGFNVPEMGVLSYFAARTGLEVQAMLFAGVLIASLGAVMDVSMSVSSAVAEVHRADPSLPRRALFRSGLEVARDTSGTMSTTLILAFTGGSLSTLIAMTAYGIHFNQLLNSDTLAVEIGQGLSASAALLITAPLASLLAALIYRSKKERLA
jgi:uncharacterized membrane protein